MPALRSSTSPGTDPGAVCLCTHAAARRGHVDRTVIPRGPLVGIGTPEECAAAILWLLSDEPPT